MFNRTSRYYWGCQVGGWTFWMLLNVVLATYYHRTLSVHYFLSQITMVLSGILFTHLLRMVIIYFDWLQAPLGRLVVVLLVAVAICAFLMTLLTGFVVVNFHWAEKTEKTFNVFKFMGSCLLVTSWTLIYFLWHFFQKDQQYKLDKLRLESVVKDLELRTIKAQLNPHFLFNALNSIRALIDENPRRARTAVTELSNILRSSMQAEKVETVSLENELNIVRDYLELEHIRFEERLKVCYDIDPDSLELPVPPMMLQTLVENAIKHGISKSVTGGTLSVESGVHGRIHRIKIRNTGQLRANNGEGGFGLESTRQRLELLYKDKANFDIYNLDATTVEARVEISL